MREDPVQFLAEGSMKKDNLQPKNQSIFTDLSLLAKNHCNKTEIKSSTFSIKSVSY